jgi:hypothetical protein
MAEEQVTPIKVANLSWMRILDENIPRMIVDALRPRARYKGHSGLPIRYSSIPISGHWLSRSPCAYHNGQRLHGAGRGQVLEIVARRALILTGSGTVIGLCAALGAGRLLGQVLYGVEPADPFTFMTVFLMMLAIALLACWVPARRAIRINPVMALRQE